MSDIKIQPSATGSATVTLTAPVSNTARTITLPDSTSSLLASDGSAANLTAIPAANITGTLPALSAANLTAIPAANITGTLPAISGANLTNLPAGGKVLQVLSTPKTDTFSTTSTSYVDITGLSIAITPAATTSKILVIAQLVTGQSTTGNLSLFKLSGGNTASYVGDTDGARPRNTTGGMVTGTYDMKGFSITYLDSPSTTSATTYTVQMNTPSGTSYINRNSTDPNATAGHRFASSITVMEIGA
jgi:hypothetical protein